MLHLLCSVFLALSAHISFASRDGRFKRPQGWLVIPSFLPLDRRNERHACRLSSSPEATFGRFRPAGESCLWRFDSLGGGHFHCRRRSSKAPTRCRMAFAVPSKEVHTAATARCCSNLPPKSPALGFSFALRTSGLFSFAKSELRLSRLGEGFRTRCTASSTASLPSRSVQHYRSIARWGRHSPRGLPKARVVGVQYDSAGVEMLLGVEMTLGWIRPTGPGIHGMCLGGGGKATSELVEIAAPPGLQTSADRCCRQCTAT